jgi:hypothetical protein
MKFTLIILFLFLLELIACRNSTEVSPKDITIEDPNLKPRNPKNYLIGHWAICSDGNDKGITQYNICPEILFGKNNTARLFLNKTFSESIRWDLNNDTLYLNHIAFFSKDTARMFKDVKYIIQRTDDSSYVYLTVQSHFSGNFFNLTRSKFITIRDAIYD